MASSVDNAEFSGMILDQDKEYFDMLSIHIRSVSSGSPPLDILFADEVETFMRSGVIRSIESIHVRTKYEAIMGEKRVCSMLRWCFWYVMFRRFPETVDVLAQDEVISDVRTKLSRKYMKLFQSLPQPKDELVNLLIFSISYIIHYCFYKYFPPQREYFDARFVIECYQILLHEFNGIEVSEIYVKMMIERVFSQKFLEYEKQNIKLMIQQQIERKKLANRAFLGFPLQFPEIQNKSRDGSQFKESILTCLKKDKKSLQEKQQRFQRLNRRHHHISTSNKTLSRIEKSTDSFQNPSVNTSPNPHKASVNHSSSTNYLQAIKSLNPNKKLRMNCNQVSPTMAKLLNYSDMNLPFTKKMIIKHVAEVQSQPILQKFDLISDQMDASNVDAVAAATRKQNQASAIHAKSLIDEYAMRAPPKEFYEQQDRYGSKVKLFKQMMDINYVLTSQDDAFGRIPSSIEMMEAYKQSKPITKADVESYAVSLKEKLQDQQKAIMEIERYKKESGNQDIFDMPFTGTRSETRNMLLKIREKCRNNIQSKVENHQQQQQQKSVMTVSSTSSVVPLPTVPILNHRQSKVDVSQRRLMSKQSIFVGGDTTTKHREENEEESSQFEKLSNYGPIDLKNQRKVAAKIVEKDTLPEQNLHASLPEYILNRTSDHHVLYKDNREVYRNKYNAIFDKISVDDKIHHIQNNLLKRHLNSNHHHPKK